MTNSSTAVINIKALLDPSDVKAKVQEIQNAFSKIKMPANLATSLNNTVTSLSKAISDYETKLNKGIKTTTDAKGINASVDEIIKGFTNLENVATKVKAELGKSVDLSSMIILPDNAVKELNKLKSEIADLEKQVQQTTSSASTKLNELYGSLKGKGATGAATKAIEVFNNGNIEEAIQLLKEAEARQTAAANNKGLSEAARTTADANAKIFDNMVTAITNAQTSAGDLYKNIETKSAQAASIIKNETDNIVNGLNDAGTAAGKAKDEISGIAPKIKDMTAAQAQFSKEVEQIKSRIQYFFGLANAINLVKRAIRSAVDTIKDLDKAMTETAVVTDYTVSDMWKQLPEYTKRANQLGVTTQQAYESATLFYQQGLNTQQAAELSTETLKMARIAGLEAAEATDRMTNALRGFNMELDAQSAQRVDDVYSQLAANSASNVDEISTAMTKVASLAHSANMEFETTAAFLSQIIETTRESAETAGTALKTVIARFSEVKKLYSEDQLKGTDEEGQTINVNKISAALQTAGIDLNKYFLGEVGLDDIFMELASKWDSLTSVQQRYIATQAAGSRQQSRFIALMQDYARTQQLVGLAYDANGASAKQFEKTQESLQSKLARLKNAWDEFLMGLANSTIVKGVVTVLTGILNIINKLTGALGNGIGFVLKWTAALSGLAAIRSVFKDGGLIGKAVGKLTEGTALGHSNFIKNWAGKATETNSAAALEAGAVNAAATTQSAATTAAATTEAAATSAATTLEAGAANAAATLQAGVTGAGAGTNINAGTSVAAKTSADVLQESNVNNATLAAAQRSGYKVQYSSPLAEIGIDETDVDRISVTQTAENLTNVADAATDATEAVSDLSDTVEIVSDATETVTNNAKTAGQVGAAATNNTTAGLAKMLPVLGYIAIAIAAVAAAYAAWLYLTPEGQLKQATAYAEAMDQAAKSAQNQTRNLKEAVDAYKDLNKQVKESNTLSGQQKAIQERNASVSTLIEQNPNLAQYTDIKMEDGQLVMTIDESSLDTAVEKAEKGAQTLASDADLAMAAKYEAQANVFENQLKQAGVDLENKTIFRADRYGGYRDTMTSAEIAKYSKIQEAQEMAQSQANAYAQKGYTEALVNSGFTDDIANIAAEAMADSFNAEDYIKQVNSQRSKNWRNGEATRSQLEAEYLKLFGTQADASMSRKELAQVIAQAQVSNAQNQKVTDLGKLLVNDSSGIYSRILQAGTGTGLAAELDLSTTDFDENNIAEVLGFGKTTEDMAAFDDALTKLEPLTGKTADQFKKQMVAQAQIIKQQQQQKKANLFEAALNNNITDTSIYQKIGQMTPQLAEMISNIVTEATDLLSSQDMSELLPDLVNLQDEESLKQIQDFASSFNLDNPIQAFQKLKDAEKDAAATGNTVFANMLDKIEVTNASVFDTGHLVQSFFVSSSYDALSDSISDFIEKNGKITADNVEELAESCEDLKILLEQDAVNAQGLATALTALETGAVSIDTITTSLLKAWSAGKDFATVIAEVNKWISEFDEGTDLKTGTDHIKTELDSLKEYVENWEFGNEPTENIWNHIFGEDTYDKYLKSFNGDFEKAEAAMKKRINQVSKWTENGGVGGLAQAEKKNLTGLSSKKDKKGNIEYTWDVSQYESTTAAIEDVSRALGVSQGAAESFILTWQTHMPELRDEWDALSHTTQVNSFAEDIAGDAVVTQQELDALKISAEELQQALEKLGKGTEIPIIVNWQNPDGSALTGDKLIEEVNKVVKATQSDGTDAVWEGNKLVKPSTKAHTDYSNLLSEGDFTRSYTETLQNGMQQSIDGLDFSSLHDHLVDAYKLTDAQATEVTNNVAKEMGENFVEEIQVTEWDETTSSFKTSSKVIEADTKEALDAGIKAAQEAADAKILAAQLAKENFADVTTSLNNAIKAAGTSGGAAAAQAIDQEISSHSYTIHVDAEVSGLPEQKATGGWANRASGGIVSSYAKGSENFHVQPGTALTGEEGPELVWNKYGGYAYVTGQGGPEFANLRPGDRIFNASETKRIFKNSADASMSFAKGGYFKSYATGAWKTSDEDSGKKGGGGSSGKDDEDNEWKNEIDWLYNLVQNLEQLERRQTSLQEEYNNLLKDSNATGKDLYKSLIKQVANLQVRLDQQTLELQKREQQMREFMDTTNDMDEYLRYNWEDRTLEIDADAIKKISDEDTKKHLDDLISEAEDIQSKIKSAEDAIDDINEELKDLENIWRDTFRDFEDRVLKAIVQSYQDVIDEYSELNTTLNDSNSAILDAINKEISLQRQIRDNTKTEEDIADSEARLAYLRRDTTGGNDLAALQLQKELEDQREQYQDNLIDQAISRLQDDNDAAAQQREKQIEIMQAQLDYQNENGEFNEYMRDLIESAISPDGTLATDSDLYNLLTNEENYRAMTDTQREVWEEELRGTFNEVVAYLLKQNGETEGTYFTAVSEAFNGLSDIYTKYIGTQSQNVTYGSSGGDGGSNVSQKPRRNNDPPPETKSYEVTIGGGITGTGKTAEAAAKAAANAAITADKGRGGSIAQYAEQILSGKVKPKAKTVKSTTTTRNAKGGLNDYTGWAWLDGTPKEPEYVLNARQTEAFLKLADVLPAAMSNTGSSVSNTFGNTNVNIAVSVDKIDSDYSVDQMVSRIKDQLFSDASYRNVNSLSFLR